MLRRQRREILTYRKYKQSLGAATRRGFAGEIFANCCIFGSMSSPKADARKQSLYFPLQMLVEIREEAKRLDRSLSWVIQRAWMVAKGEIRDMPGSDSR